VHTAAVVSFDPSKAQLMLTTQKNGTRNVLDAARKSRSVRKFVMTSSVVSLHDGPANNRGNVWTSNDWNTTSSLSRNAYHFAKTQSERMAWEFVNNVPAGEHRFDFVTINPSLVLGPTIAGTDGGFNSSYEVPIQLFTGKMFMAPRLAFGIVDVRDVAAAHVFAVEKDEANGKRFIVDGGTLWTLDIAKIISRHFPAAKCPTRESPNFLLYPIAIFEPQLSFAFLWSSLGITMTYDSSPSRDILGVRYTSLEEAIRAAGESIQTKLSSSSSSSSAAAAAAKK